MRRRIPSLLRAAVRPTPTFRTRPPFAGCAGRGRRWYAVAAANLTFGQPLHETHPHLLQPGELTPGITALEYHHRRAALAQKLPRHSIAVLAAHDVKFRSGAVFYEFHQDPNFFYLTGFNEPDAVAIIAKGASDVEYTFHLYVRPKDRRAEQWEGARSGVQAAEDVFNADVADDVVHVASTLRTLVRDAQAVYSDAGNFAPSKGATREALAQILRDAPTKPLRPLMNELRVIKSSAELDLMRRAGTVSGTVITEAMKRPYLTEKQLWVDLAYGFKSRGLDGEAYIPVVAGGQNGLSIHYVRNDAELRDGEMVLVDAGGEIGGYITDITRTWPISGRFTAPQRDLYTMVLGVQANCVRLCREDAEMSLDALHSVAESELKRGLRDLGFNTDRRECVDTLFPHHVGHYIGLDVHDAPGFPRTHRLKENQCITIEPGVYVPPDDDRWPSHFRGLGIRIEDSVKIGRNDVEVLTKSAVKEVEDIEDLRRSGK